MADKKDVHAWVQTISAAVQAIAVAGGVIFAVIQLNQWVFEQDQGRREATLEHLQQLYEEPVRPIISFLQQAYFVNLLFQSGQDITHAEFLERTAPLTAFFGKLETCVRLQICDRNLAAAEICPIVALYRDKYLTTALAGTTWGNPSRTDSNPLKPEVIFKSAKIQLEGIGVRDLCPLSGFWTEDVLSKDVFLEPQP